MEDEASMKEKMKYMEPEMESVFWQKEDVVCSSLVEGKENDDIVKNPWWP